MRLPPAVIVHGRMDIDTVLGHDRPVTLLSARGAALYAGCLWWDALTRLSGLSYPRVPLTSLLDCADASGQALAAIRIGLPGLVLDAHAPGRSRLEAIARGAGVLLLATPPPAIDMADRGAARRLDAWLLGRSAPGDSGNRVG